MLLLATVRRDAWGGFGAWTHAGFGVLMVATATFSTRSWVPDAAYDPVEDALHSVTATAMGFAFAVGVLSVLVSAATGRDRSPWPHWPHRPYWLLDAAALAAAVVLPLGMVAFAGAAGVLQRVMFTVAYVWYATEAVRVR